MLRICAESASREGDKEIRSRTNLLAQDAQNDIGAC